MNSSLLAILALSARFYLAGLAEETTVVGDLSIEEYHRERVRWRVLIGLLGLGAFVGLWGLMFWVFSDPDRREFVRTVLINFKTGEARRAH